MRLLFCVALALSSVASVYAQDARPSAAVAPAAGPAVADAILFLYGLPAPAEHNLAGEVPAAAAQALQLMSVLMGEDEALFAQFRGSAAYRNLLGALGMGRAALFLRRVSAGRTISQLIEEFVPLAERAVALRRVHQGLEDSMAAGPRSASPRQRVDMDAGTAPARFDAAPPSAGSA